MRQSTKARRKTRKKRKTRTIVSCQRTEEEGDEDKEEDDEDEDDVKEEDNGDAVAGLQKVNPVFVHLIPVPSCQRLKRSCLNISTGTSNNKTSQSCKIEITMLNYLFGLFIV